MNGHSEICKRCCTRISDLRVTYGSRVALRDVNLHFHCGELTAVVGPNGAGKTTLFRAILGEVPYAGSVSFVSANATRKPCVGYVPQRVVFDRHEPVTTLDILAVSLARRPAWFQVGRATRERARAALAAVQGEHLLDRPVGGLSGGELQRVLLAMAMTPVPQLLLLDEPLAGMDAEGLRAFYQIVCDLRRMHDISILLVTHDVAAIAPHADRIVVLNQTVLADGPPDQVLADSEARRAAGAGLWNLARIPDALRAEDFKDHHD